MSASRAPLLIPDVIKSIISAIVSPCNNCNGEMVPARGTLSNFAKLFRVTKQAVLRIWVVAKRNKNKPHKMAFTASPQRKGPLVGCSLKWDRDAFIEEIASLRSHQQRTMRAISYSTGISKSTIHRFYRKEHIIGRVSSALKPTITDSNKFLHVMYAADRIDLYNDADAKMH
jgi:hypothetical protein